MDDGSDIQLDVSRWPVVVIHAPRMGVTDERLRAFFDEFYEVVVIKPLHRLAGWLHRVVDVAVIDGLFVLGPARLTRAISDTIRRLQDGDVQTYVAAVLVGCALLLVFVN